MRKLVRKITDPDPYVGYDTKEHPYGHWGDSYMRQIIEGVKKDEGGIKPEYADEIIQYLNISELERDVRLLRRYTRTRLCEELSREGLRVTEDSLHEVIGNFIGTYLAACTGDDDAEDDVRAIITQNRRQQVMDMFKDALANEAQGVCPFPQCGKPLVTESSEKPVADIGVIIIDPNGDVLAPRNMLACCHDHAIAYGDQSDSDTLKKATLIKEKLEAQVEASLDLSREKVRENVAKVIQDLQFADITQLNQEILGPVVVEEKLPRPEHRALAAKINFNVKQYFRTR